MEERRSGNFLIILLFVLILGNLFILDLKIFYPHSPLFLSEAITNPTPAPFSTTTDPSGTDLSCPTSCVALINQVTSPSAAIGAPEITTSPVALQRTGVSREIYIPLGSGSTKKSDWDDLTATETIIDPSAYGTFRQAYLTYSLSNPTQNGQVEARLYNATDKYPIYGSHVIMNGPSSQTINTGEFPLPAGNKLYRVQLRSSLSYPAYLDNAKMRIVTE